ncbi:hypothetical protein AB6C43_04950 [Vibrio splendidus]|jgi:hypothetical protein
MNISFKWQGKQYLNFETTSDAWKALDIPGENKVNIIRQAQYDEAVTLRKIAYAEESDPLRNEWKYEEEGGNPDADKYKQKWLDKVVEIKKRIPFPELIG